MSTTYFTYDDWCGRLFSEERALIDNDEDVKKKERK